MKFALVENIKTEATKGAKGICRSCGSELIAVCGPIKINHWRHKKDHNCDPWWENETEWHRSWKNNYPGDWQETPLRDEQTGEIHIADVRTSHNLVIEFQHSHIDPQERTSRENFYKNMVWVVDGTRLKRDYPRFIKGKNKFQTSGKKGIYLIENPVECFPSAWIGSSVPVIFDFRGIETIKYAYDLRYNLYCLLPKQTKSKALLLVISREAFISNTINGEWYRHQEPQKQDEKSAIQSKTIKRRKEPTHYYDPKKGRLVKKWRL